MTVQEIIDMFDNDKGEVAFADIKPERRHTRRPDLQAFLILERLFPGQADSDSMAHSWLRERAVDIICAAEHDMIYLEPRVEDIAATATIEDILDLIRCGVSYSDDDGLFMFA